MNLRVTALLALLFVAPLAFAAETRNAPPDHAPPPAKIEDLAWLAGEIGGSLEYRLKHFNADLTGWEEKAEVRSFPLVAREGDAWYFDGLTVRRDGADGLIGAVNARFKDGTQKEFVLRYKRVR